MEEDEEYFYDSLDEEISPLINVSFENTNNVENSSSQPSVTSSKIKFVDCRETFKNENITKIPLYVGETNKEDIKILLKKKQTGTSLNSNTKKSTSCLSTISLKQNSSSTKEKSFKSYWHIYCQKNNIPVAPELTDSARSLYDGSTERTYASFLTTCGLNGPIWDVPGKNFSGFNDFVPKQYENPLNDSITQDEVASTHSSSCLDTSYILPEVDIDSLRSISQCNLLSTEKRRPSNSKSSISNNLQNQVNLLKSESDPSSVQKLMKSQSSTSNLSRLRPTLSKNASSTSNTFGIRTLILKDLGPDETKSETSPSSLQKITKTQSNTSNLSRIRPGMLSKTSSNTSNLSGIRSLSLKNLGPDENKINLLKKQQEYGLKASNRNRAKILQSLGKINQQLKRASEKK